jgi:hypothetical protein
MPLARIFTRNPERTADLSAQLKEQGYKVEVVSPDQADLAPADLEIEFELCERADVLERAANLATELEADIAVAPGILQPAPEPKIVVSAQPFVPPVMEHRVEIASQPELRSAEVEPAELKSPEFKSDAEREFEAAFASEAAMPAAMEATAEIIEIPVMEHAPLPPVAIIQEPVRAESVKAMEPVKMAENSSVSVPVHFSEPVKEPATSFDPAPYLAQLTPFSTPAKSDTLKVNPAAQRSEKPSPSADKSKHVLEDGAKIAAKTLAGAQSLAANTAASMRDHFQEYKKRAQVRSAEARAAHEARLLDLEQRRAEAQQRAAELEAARVAASVRLKELLQQRTPGLQSLQETGRTEQVRQEAIRQEQVSAELNKQQPIQDPAQQEKKRQLEHGLWQPETGAYTPYSSGPKEDARRSSVPPAASFRSTPPMPPASSTPPKSNRAVVKTTPATLWRRINPPLRAVLTGAAAVSALFVMGIALGFFHSRTPLASTPDHGTGNAASVKAAQNQPATPQAEPAKTASAKPQPGTKSKAQSGDTEPSDTTVQATAKPSPKVQHVPQVVAQQTETQIGSDVVIRRFQQPVPTQKPKQSGQQAGLKHFSDLDN